MKDLEIAKMLTVSTAHLTKEDVRYLELAGSSDYGDLTVYEKRFHGQCYENLYGWFVYAPDDLNERNAPENLRHILTFAKNNECDWICFDEDGCVVKELNTYDW